MIDAKQDYERKTLVLLELPQGFCGVTVVKHSWRDGHITGTILKNDGHKEIKHDWQKLSDLK